MRGGSSGVIRDVSRWNARDGLRFDGRVSGTVRDAPWGSARGGLRFEGRGSGELRDAPRTSGAGVRRGSWEQLVIVTVYGRQHKWGGNTPRSCAPETFRYVFQGSKGVHRGTQGGPAKPSFRLCGERRSKGASAVFAAGGNGVSGLCDDERALWLLSLA